MKYTWIIGILLVGCSSNYSNGYRIGRIRKFSEKGIFIKSWEGQLLLGGVVPSGDKNATLVNETFEFSVDPERGHGENINEVVDEINKCAESEKRVKLYYNQNTLLKIRTDTDYMIWKAEVLE